MKEGKRGSIAPMLSWFLSKETREKKKIKNKNQGNQTIAITSSVTPPNQNIFITMPKPSLSCMPYLKE